MKTSLSILTLLTLGTSSAITTSSIINSNTNTSTLLLINDTNINKNVYTAVQKEVIIDGTVFNTTEETYLMYLSNNTINTLIKVHNTFSLHTAVPLIFLTISLFESTFSPSQPSDWFDIKGEISALLYSSIESSKSETGTILQFQRLTLTPEIQQDWTIVSINPQK